MCKLYLFWNHLRSTEKVVHERVAFARFVSIEIRYGKRVQPALLAVVGYAIASLLQPEEVLSVTHLTRRGVPCYKETQ